MVAKLRTVVITIFFLVQPVSAADPTKLVTVATSPVTTAVAKETDNAPSWKTSAIQSIGRSSPDWRGGREELTALRPNSTFHCPLI